MSNLDDLLDLDEPTDPGVSGKTTNFWVARYGPAYNLAGLLRTSQGVILIGTVTSVGVCVWMWMSGGMGSRAYLGLGLYAGLTGFLGWLLVGAAAALVRAVTDAAVSLVPGLSEEQRLEIIRDS